MNKQTEALALALEALSPWAGEDANHTEQYAAYHAIREALAEQETVLPGGGHVPAVPVAVYGYCPECGGAGVMRERRPNGDDKCTNGHKYPSSKALAEQPAEYASESDTEELIRLNELPEPLRLAAMLEKTMQWPLHGKAADCLRKMYAAMAEQPAPATELRKQQDPVAVYVGETWCGSVVRLYEDLPLETPLYTFPQPSKPLTDEQIQAVAFEAVKDNWDWLKFARAIEAAHGIKENT